MEQKHFEEIMEAVHQGIVASKKSESEFFGEFGKQLKQVADYQKVQNGRTEAHSEKIQQLDETLQIGIAKVNTALWAFGLTIPLILALVGTLYWSMISKVDTVHNDLMNHMSQSK